MSRQVLGIVHQAHSSPGQVGVVLKQLGVRLHLRRPVLGQGIPRDLGRYDGLIVFGGPMSANDPLPGLAFEMRLIERWLHTEKPLWGICLGAQLMTRVLGGAVSSRPDARVEIGWYPVCALGPGRAVFRGLGHVYQWHREGFELPDGAHRLASAPKDADFYEQAFAVGRSALATQFHPEMHPRMMRRWLSRAGEMLVLPGARPEVEHLQGNQRYFAKQARWLHNALDRWMDGRLVE